MEYPVTRFLAGVLTAFAFGWISPESAALLIATTSLLVSMYAVVIAQSARLSRSNELSHQSEVVAEVATVASEVEAALRDIEG